MARKSEGKPESLTVEVNIEETRPEAETPVLSERTLAEMEAGRAALAANAASLVAE